MSGEGRNTEPRELRRHFWLSHMDQQSHHVSSRYSAANGPKLDSSFELNSDFDREGRLWRFSEGVWPYFHPAGSKPFHELLSLLIHRSTAYVVQNEEHAVQLPRQAAVLSIGWIRCPPRG